MYEAAQKSLEEMTANHAKSVEVHKELRDSLVAIAKRLFRGEVTEIERRGYKFSDLSDSALVTHLEGFLTDLVAKRRADYAEMEALRAVLAQKGYELPDNHDIRAWVSALAVQREEQTPGFPASIELGVTPLEDIDAELAAMLAAEGMTGTVEAAEVITQADPTIPERTVPEKTTPEATISAPGEGSAEGADLADLFGDASGDGSAESPSEDSNGTDPRAGETAEKPEVAESKTAEAETTEPNLSDLFDDPLADLEDEVDLSDLDLSDVEGVDGVSDEFARAPNGEIEPEIFDVPGGVDGETDEVGKVTEEAEAGVESGVESASEGVATGTTALREPGGGEDLADLFGGGADGPLEPATTNGTAAGDDLADLFGDPDEELVAGGRVPVGADDLAALFGGLGDAESEDDDDDAGDDAAGGDEEDEDEEAGGGRPRPVAIPGPAAGQAPRPPKPAFMTPDEAAATRIKPELIIREESKKAQKKRPVKERAVRPDPIRFDIPNSEGSHGKTELSEDLSRAMLSAVEVTHPVFTADLEAVAGSPEMVAAWETQMRSVDNPPVRFLSPRSHHRSRGSLVLPHRMRTEPTPEFDRSWWGQALNAYRGNVLYEIAVLLNSYGQYIVSMELEEELVAIRANLPHGLTGIIVVAGDELGEGGRTRQALCERLAVSMGERLATILVLGIRRGREQQLVELISEEGKKREWRPSMPVAVDLAWSYAAGRASTAKLALGGG